MTTTLDELEQRLAALEDRAGVGVLAANPPVTIGELNDVPSPGSPIASQWSQEVTRRILHRFATVAARDAAYPAATAAAGAICVTLDTGFVWTVRGGIWCPVAGTVVAGGSAGIPDINTLTGLFDVYQFGTVSFPYPVRITAVSALYLGGSGGLASAYSDIKRNDTAAVVGGGQAVQAPAGLYATAPLSVVWTIPAGNTATGTVRISVTALASGTCHTFGTVSWTYVAT